MSPHLHGPVQRLRLLASALIGLVVAREDLGDRGIPQRPLRRCPDHPGVERAWGDLGAVLSEHAADWSDPEPVPVGGDEFAEFRCGQRCNVRGSLSRTKKDVAALSTSMVSSSSRLRFFSSRICLAVSVLSLSRCLSSIWAPSPLSRPAPPCDACPRTASHRTDPGSGGQRCAPPTTKTDPPRGRRRRVRHQPTYPMLAHPGDDRLGATGVHADRLLGVLRPQHHRVRIGYHAGHRQPHPRTARREIGLSVCGSFTAAPTRRPREIGSSTPRRYPG